MQRLADSIDYSNISSCYMVVIFFGVMNIPSIFKLRSVVGVEKINYIL